MCTVTIQDTGVGIGQERMVSLFDTIGTSDLESSSQYDDEVRLGLPLAFRYCRLMSGNLAVKSQLGQGSVVVVTLPQQSRRVKEQAGACRTGARLAV